jgi:hypothetical protein
MLMVNGDEDGEFDDDLLVKVSRRASELWGLDTAIVRPPGNLDDIGRARVAPCVHPHVLMREQPGSLATYGKEVLA